MSEIVKLYNPANAASLTPEQIAGLRNLTSVEIKELANAYPNRTMERAYLLIVDSTKEESKQLPQLSTFENLWNLREKNAQRQFVAYGFKGIYKTINTKNVKHDVLDLSETELMDLPGFKTANASQEVAQDLQEVKIRKIKKLKIE